MGPPERSPGYAGNSARLSDGHSCPLPSAQCKRLEGGLDKLKEATIQLDELNQKLAEQKIVLAEKSAACEALLEEIAINTATGEPGPGRPAPWGWAHRATLPRGRVWVLREHLLMLRWPFFPGQCQTPFSQH